MVVLLSLYVYVIDDDSTNRDCIAIMDIRFVTWIGKRAIVLYRTNGCETVEVKRNKGRRAKRVRIEYCIDQPLVATVKKWNLYTLFVSEMD